VVLCEVSDRSDSVYQPDQRTGMWSKYRINLGQELVVGGYGGGRFFCKAAWTISSPTDQTQVVQVSISPSIAGICCWIIRGLATGSSAAW
jgi:hypothetical protein